MKINYIHEVDYHNWVLGASHPTQGRRYTNATALLGAIAAQHGIEVETLPGRLATREELELVHTGEYIYRVVDQHVSGAWDGANAELASLATRLYGGTMAAVELALAGELNTVHLPGAKHHAMASYASGFCVFADFAGAAAALSQLGKRVAILDIDVHHGDGTEALCRNNPDVLTFSVHQGGIFPGTGSVIESDTASHVYNRPLKSGDGDVELLAAVQDFVDACREFEPGVIMIAGGADGHAQDSLASLQYSVNGFNRAVGLVRRSFESTPIIFGGAGGYRPDDYTPQMWVTAICALAGFDASVIDERELELAQSAITRTA